MALTKVTYSMIKDAAINVKDRGAIGNGVTDDTAAFQLAITSALATNTPIYVPSGTYVISTPLVAAGALKIFGDGASSILNCSSLAGATSALTIEGSLSATTTTMTAFPALNARTISVGSSAGFAYGDMIQITSTQPFSTQDPTYLKGELGFVQSVGSGTITLNAGLKDTYTSGTVTVRKINAIENPIVADLKMIGAGAATGNYGVVVNYAKHPVCQNVHLIDFEDQAFAYSFCDSGSIANCKVENCSGIINGVGYAFGLDLLTQFSHVTDCFASNVSCGFSTGGLLPVWNCVVDSNSFYGGNSTRPLIQTHINGANIVISNNTVSSGQIGIGVFARGNVITGNNVSNQEQYGIYLIEEGVVNGQIVGNKTQDCFRGVGVGSYTGSDTPNVLIQSNQLMNCTANGISAGVDNVVISNNVMSNVSPGILFGGSSACTIENNEIIDVTNFSQAYGVYLAPSASGAEFIYVKNNKIREVNVTGQIARGVIVEANCLNAYVTGNVFDMNIAAANYIDNSGVGTVIGGNVIYKDLQNCATFASAGVTNATTAGFAKTTATVGYEVNGRLQVLNATDDLWDLTGVSTSATEFMKVALCLDISQNPVIVQGVKVTGAQTLARVPRNIPINLCPIGIVAIPPSYAGGSLAGFDFYSVLGGQP
jgi:parallel beta-helix repeat protein